MAWLVKRPKPNSIFFFLEHPNDDGGYDEDIDNDNSGGKYFVLFPQMLPKMCKCDI